MKLDEAFKLAERIQNEPKEARKSCDCASCVVLRSPTTDTLARALLAVRDLVETAIAWETDRPDMESVLANEVAALVSRLDKEAP